jgi:cellulose synthase/poly-beta-1,6-N-acetylglucosamine synthase-like glycosyltransferase
LALDVDSQKWGRGLSIIVPTLNEAGNIKPLAERIYASITKPRAKKHIPRFEIIFVDDYSTDKTVDNIKALDTKYHSRIVEKTGDIGKAYSLVQGFAAAKYDLLCYIDADLQYPPEVIPQMVEKVFDDAADLVISNRVTIHTSMSRQAISKINKVQNRLLQGNHYDTQSGLKLFRHDLLQYFELNPQPWTLDMELIAYAETLGCRIESVDIDFAVRASGGSKVNVRKVSLQILKRSIQLRFKPLNYLNFNDQMTSEFGNGFFYKGSTYIPHSNVERRNSAMNRVLPKQILFIAGIVAVLILGFILRWHAAVTIIIALLTVLYFTDLLFNLFLVYRSFSRTPELKVSAAEVGQVPEDEWPTYTIFCPLYKESAVLPQFVRALSRLDYDHAKLQVMLLLEEDDADTIEAAENMSLPDYFQIVVVPHSYPKTKPKACNYGLTVATGEYVVIYDAEDVPNTLQLKQAYLGFKRSPAEVVCIQGKLNFYNPRQNLLTRAFTAEYSLWFDLVLTGLQSINAPIPLGGTSNHFKTHKLRELGGWDAFNVTEDADLGIRLAKQGYRTAIIDAVTLEEANSELKNWFWQRTRWLKGYMQTYLVHSRRLRDFPKGRQRIHAITFQFIIGGKVLSIFINPLMWALTITYFVLRASVGPTIQSFFPTTVLYLAVCSLIFGNFLYLYYYMIGCAKRENYDLIKYAFLIPFYWLAMSAAGWVALVELIYKPHYWSKTKHGLHLSGSELATESPGVD